MKGKIMLVDDNEEFLDSTKDVLEIEGFEVVPAINGEEALKFAETQSFDVIVMDIKMPGMNGVESFIEMKRRNLDVKVIMATAYSVDDLIQQAMEEGAWAVLQKPLDISELLNTIEEARESGSGELILVAEDDKALCKNLQDILCKEGFGVVVAHDGEEALKKATENNFDVILLDMKLPVFNGLEVFRRIKTLKPETIAILISGYPQEMHGQIEQAMNESAFTFLRKPLDMGQLIKTLNSIFKIKNGGH